MRSTIIFSLICLTLIRGALPCTAEPAAMTALQEHRQALDNFSEKLEKFTETAAQIKSQLEAERDKVQRERDRLKDRNDNDDNDDRERLRQIRKDAREKRAELRKNLARQKSEMEDDYKKLTACAENLKSAMQETGFEELFDFNYLTEELKKSYRSLEPDSDFSGGITNKLRTGKDPSVLLALLRLEQVRAENLLEDPYKPGELNGNLTAFETFYKFYTLLNDYRVMTNDFGQAPEDNTTPGEEIKRKYKLLLPLFDKMEDVIRKNDPDFAKELNLEQLKKAIEKHYRIYLFPTRLKKELSLKELSTCGPFSRVNSKIKKDKKSRTPEEENKAVLQEYMAELDAVAEEPGFKIDLKTMPKTKKRPRKRRNRKKDTVRQVLSVNTLRFADISDPAAIQAAAVKKKDTEKNKEQPSAPEKSPEMPAQEELKTFIKARDSFRREYAGMGSLSVGGMNEEMANALLCTLTDEGAKLFDSATTKLLSGGTTAEHARAAAFFLIQKQEKNGTLKAPDKNQMQELYKKMETYRQEN